MIKTTPSEIFGEWKQFESYRTQEKLKDKWINNIKMIEGDQWPPYSEKTQFMPRPVINQCDFIVENKQSNILSQSMKMLFSPEELPEGKDNNELVQASQSFTDAAQNTWNDIDQDSLNEEYVTDILALGTGIFHYFYDSDLSGGQFTKYKGKLQGEQIDPMDIMLGNPKLKATETQKQPYIGIRTKEDVDIIKEISKKFGSEYQNIVADEDGKKKDEYEKTNIEINQVTCITKYYKKDGRVYWTKVTENAVVRKPRPLAPDNIKLEDGTVIETKPFTIYPVEMCVFKKRKKCSFGRSIIDDIKTSQIALNWGIGMMLLSVQQTAWPKIIAKVGALVQQITNEPGEIIYDELGANGTDNIKYMQPPNFSQMPILLSDKLIDLMRQVTNTTELTSGEVMGANMAASAIIALQSQAKKPNENYQNKLYRSMRNVGRIYEEFFKCYYNLPIPVTVKDKTTGKEYSKPFTGTKFADMGFGLKIDVGPSSVLSESLQMTTLEYMAGKNWINKYQYTKYAPSNVVPAELKRDFEKEQEELKNSQGGGIDIQKILAQLSPEERAAVQKNPALLNQIMGGMQNGAMPQMPNAING